MSIKPLITKSTIGLIGISGLGTGGYFGYQALNNKTEIQKEESKSLSIERVLQNERYTLLSGDVQNDSSWSAILNNYKEVIKKQEDLKFKGFTGEDPTSSTAPTALDTLKKKCNEITIKPSNDIEMLKKARKWCVTPVNVSKLLSDRGLTPLKTNIGEASEEVDAWTKNIDAYKEAKKSNPNIEQLIDIQETTQVTSQHIIAAKQKCQGLSAILSHAETFETSLNIFELWCVNKSS